MGVLTQDFFKVMLTSAYQAMDSVCLDSLLINEEHYTVVKDGELILEKRINKYEQDIINTYICHYVVIFSMKDIISIGNSKDPSNLLFVVEKMINAIAKYAGIVKKQQADKNSSFVYHPEDKFLTYSSDELIKFNVKKTYEGALEDCTGIKNLFQHLQLKDFKFGRPEFGFRMIPRIPEMTYEQKYQRALSALGQFGLKFKLKT